MADIGTLHGQLRMDNKKLRTDLASAQASIASFGKKSQKSLALLKTSAIGLGVAFAAMAGSRGIAAATKEFIKFEDAALDLQKVLTDSEGDVKQYVGSIRNLSKTFGKASAEVLQGAANFKQAGFSIQEALLLQEKTLGLVVISELETAEATGLLISALKGFKAPATEATRLIDVMNEVSNKYATSLGELARGMSLISPIAKLMGFSFEETAGLLTPIIEVFRSGTEAGNALKIGLLRLVDDNNQVVEALDSIGVSQKDLNGNLRSGKDILIDVQRAFVGLGKEQKVFVASQLAGARQAGRLLEVFNGLNKTMEVTSIAMGAAGSGAKEQEIRMQALGFKIDRLKVAFSDLMILLGEHLAPVVSTVTEKMTAFVNTMTNGETTTNLDYFIKGIKDLAEAFKSLGAGIKITGAGLTNLDTSKVGRLLELQKAKGRRSGKDLIGVMSALDRGDDFLPPEAPQEYTPPSIPFDYDLTRKGLGSGSLSRKTEEAEMEKFKLFKEGIKKKHEAQEESDEFMVGLSRELAANMTNAFDDLFFRTMKQDWEDFADFAEGVVDSMLKSISAMLAKWVAEEFKKAFSSTDSGSGFGGIISSLFGGFSGGGGGSGGAASGSFGGGTSVWVAKGGVFDKGNMTAFARGGVVNTPTIFPMANGAGLMGEAGPEAVMPLSRDSSGELGVKGGGTPSVTVVIKAPVETMGKSDREIIDVVTEGYGRNVGSLRSVIRGDMGE